MTQERRGEIEGLVSSSSNCSEGRGNKALSEEETIKWRLSQIEAKSDKLEASLDEVSDKMKDMTGNIKSVLEGTTLMKNTFIFFVVSNTMMYFLAQWPKFFH